MVTEFPFAVWKSMVQKQEDCKKNQKSNHHTQIDDMFCDGSNQREFLFNEVMNPVSKNQQGKRGNNQQRKDYAVECGKQAQHNKIAGFFLTVNGIQPLDKRQEGLGAKPDCTDNCKREDMYAACRVDIVNQCFDKFMKGFRNNR